jgi:hypothetical protein|tara:strand:- start:343 stop:669 length:327 start_codon:yes stop_codon:yes gene_type:complete
MSDKVVLDKSNGRQTDMHFDDAEGTYIFNTHEQATPLLDENKRKYNEYGDKLTMGKRGEWHHAASIPATIWEKWLKETNGEIQKDSKLLARYLNDPDNKYFKTAPTNI